MVHIIRGASANDLFNKTAKYLLKNGHYKSPRGLKTLEIEHAWLVLSNPLENIVSLKARNMDMDYLKGEMSWYKSGSLNVEDITKYSSFWSKLADSNGTVNSNYGFLALKEKHGGLSQYEWCKTCFEKDINTRQAVINYNQPRHKYVNNKDFVCTLNQNFVINKGRLDSTVLMRSNDLIFGLTYDLPWFTYLQERLSKDIVKPLGVYNHYAASLHVYKRHFDMLEKIANERV